MADQPNPSRIMETATGFWTSKVLLTAVELDLFTTLNDDQLTAAELGERLALHPRGTYDFFDALVALGFLNRDGDGPDGRYRNTPETSVFLNSGSPAYIGGWATMLNDRLYAHWGRLSDVLKSGRPLSGTGDKGASVFEELYSSPESLKKFLEGMSGIQESNFRQLAEKFDFAKYETVTDAGGALALLSRTVGARHPHLTFNTFDLPAVAPHAEKSVAAAGMADRIRVMAGDFFTDDLPKADVVTMGNVLHDWNLEDKKTLVRKAYEALSDGGAFIAIENLIDDKRRENAFGLMMSLNMMIEFGDAFDYSGADFREWGTEAGFKRFDILPLSGPSSAAIAYK